MSKKLSKECAENGKDRKLTTYRYKVKSCYIGCDLLSAPLSRFSQYLFGSRIEHSWVEIQTEQNDIWYCAQFDKLTLPPALLPPLCLFRCTNSTEVTAEGIRAAGRKGKVKITTQYSGKLYKNMGDIYDWMNKYDDHYNLLSNNCQIFCLRFLQAHTSKNTGPLKAEAFKPLSIVSGRDHTERDKGLALMQPHASLLSKL